MRGSSGSARRRPVSPYRFSESSRSRAARARVAQRLLLAFMVVLLVRLLYLQVAEHDRLFELAKDNVLREEVLPAIRGVIRARDGRVLVDSKPSCAVAIDPYHRHLRGEPGQLEQTLERISDFVDIDPATMAATIDREKGRSYLPVFLKRHLSDEEVARIEEHRDELPGVSIEIEPRRHYTHGPLAAHVLGYVGEITEEEVKQRAKRPAAGRTQEGRGGGIRAAIASLLGRRGGGQRDATAIIDQDAGDGVATGEAVLAGQREYRPGDVIGRVGLEAVFEDRLCGRNGLRMVEVNALGRRVDRLVSLTPFASVVPPVAGEEMVLTLDLDLQMVAEAAFPDSHAGAVVVLDVEKGDVLAALSRPTFDPNGFTKGFSGEAWKALANDPNHPLLNRIVNSRYPPGSVCKVITGAAALSLRVVAPGETMKICAGGFAFGNRYFRCHHVHGKMAFSDAMRVSCDTYFYQAGLRAGLDGLADYARRFGFGTPTGIVLGEKRPSLYPDRAWYDKNYGQGRWTEGVVLNLSIGQGEILVTPVQLAVMMGAIGTGKLVVPRLVERIGDDPGPAPAAREVDVPERVRRMLVESLERVVTEGTGRRAAVPGVRVAGKTGTAQNPHGEDHALFAAFAPVPAPEVAVAVVIETIGHGGEFAAPVAGAILKEYFSRGVEPLAGSHGGAVEDGGAAATRGD